MPQLLSRALLTLGTLGAGGLVLAACTGKVLSLGGNGTQSQAISPGDVSGVVLPCQAGSAHPNVCCAAGPGQSAACAVYPEAPFTKCGAGTSTYPDPRTCCALDSTGGCVPTPPATTPDSGVADAGNPSGDAGDGGGGSCITPCPVGWYASPSAPAGECCQSDPSGGTVCGAPATAPSCGGGCACPGCTAGTPCPPCNCPTPTCPPPSTVCGECPAGWVAPATDPGLCCSTASTGTTECFSQAVPPPSPTPVDAGPPTTIDAGAPTGFGCGGNTDGSCACEEDVGGVAYHVTCPAGQGPCTCNVADAGTTSSVPNPGNACGDPTTLFAACGFPKG